MCHIEDTKDEILPVIEIIQNPQIQEPSRDDPQTLTGISLQMLLEHQQKINGNK